MPYGRGGAGNYEAAEAAARAAKERAKEDIEAQQEVGATTGGHEESRPLPQYSHLGRGGAGNYYSPKELDQSGHFTDGKATAATATAQPSSDRAVLPQTATQSPVYRGRGGAGNFEFNATQSAEQNKKLTAEQREEQEHIRSRIAQDVDTGLKKPARARLPDPEAPDTQEP